jgi:hypothetical protein
LKYLLHNFDDQQQMGNSSSPLIDGERQFLDDQRQTVDHPSPTIDDQGKILKRW